MGHLNINHLATQSLEALKTAELPLWPTNTIWAIITTDISAFGNYSTRTERLRACLDPPNYNKHVYIIKKASKRGIFYASLYNLELLIIIKKKSILPLIFSHGLKYNSHLQIRLSNPLIYANQACDPLTPTPTWFYASLAATSSVSLSVGSTFLFLCFLAPHLAQDLSQKFLEQTRGIGLIMSNSLTGHSVILAGHRGHIVEHTSIILTEPLHLRPASMQHSHRESAEGACARCRPWRRPGPPLPARSRN